MTINCLSLDPRYGQIESPPGTGPPEGIKDTVRLERKCRGHHTPVWSPGTSLTDQEGRKCRTTGQRHPQVFVLAGHSAALGVERKNAPGTGQVQAHRLDVSHPIPNRLPGHNSNFARTCSSSEDEEGGPAFTTALMYPTTPADGSSTIRFRPGILLLRCHKVVNEDRYVALHPG
ncbi:hypothetical protein CSPX01_11305 [Colletotrichum filicis]|nr:hypothetical protein CSPX01_11305 [Colletotrichum filicis]